MSVYRTSAMPACVSVTLDLCMCTCTAHSTKIKFVNRPLISMNSKQFALKYNRLRFCVGAFQFNSTPSYLLSLFYT